MSYKFDSLGDRMKGYEGISRNFLTRRIPAIIRIDGKAFHTFTRGMVKPFDSILMGSMQKTMQYLCKNIQGCVFGYTQSDEITLVLTDYETVKTSAWFDYNVQKMTSVAASMATLAFNKAFLNAVKEAQALENPVYEGRFFCATFDARAFSVPVQEVCNCLIWRQQDATRNSIMSVGQANFSHKELHGKNCDEVQEMLFQERNINWNDLPVQCKRGACCYKQQRETQMPNPRSSGEVIAVTRREWVIDKEPPIFTQDRDYIEKWL